MSFYKKGIVPVTLIKDNEDKAYQLSKKDQNDIALKAFKKNLEDDDGLPVAVNLQKYYITILNLIYIL